MQRLITRTELAKLAGVSQAAITKACAAKLAPACEGLRVDLAHPAVHAYLQRRGIKPPAQLDEQPARAPTAQRKTSRKPAAGPARAPTAAPRAAKTAPPAPPAVSQPAGAKQPVRLVVREVTDVSQVADMTIREVVAKYGTVTAFKDWLQALRTIEEVREKNLRNAETDGNLISIRLVRTHVMGALESGNRRLLTDAPKTIARQLYAAAKSSVTIEDAEQMVREIISSQLKPMKDAAAKTLREPSAA